MSFELIETLKKCRAICLKTLIEQKSNRRQNEHILKDIVGFLTVFPTRPCTSTYLDILNLPLPKEIAIMNDDFETLLNDTSSKVPKYITQVSSHIYRSLIDDSYIFKTKSNIDFYFNS